MTQQGGFCSLNYKLSTEITGKMFLFSHLSVGFEFFKITQIRNTASCIRNQRNRDMYTQRTTTGLQGGGGDHVTYLTKCTKIVSMYITRRRSGADKLGVGAYYNRKI